ncbi:SPL family radical SAM protein [Cesiribacter andamanensis]|uniref:Spore photoproduct lyase n=1 Tax=Cesiribacter andamanensis AMV16 TaxID=1279009 RepID=M7NSX0_9BACT|nr:spore photoproduct lyase [Cesiribacter andamanensis]EMR01589.1 Spore photoproduct lyase [Cesiribacter andamanensis AMV16]
MPKLKRQRTKTLSIKANERSSDFVTPNFIYGCLGGCRNTYCYVMRYNYEHVFINENLEEILTRLELHVAAQPFPKEPNQVDPLYWTYDIGCATDISLHWKHYPWERVFGFFKKHPRAKATFATKYVNEALLAYDPQKKVRIRFSLMPQSISSRLEPNTAPIAERLAALVPFAQAGYEVHLNFSPIVVYEGWLDDYRQLFLQVAAAVPEALREEVKAEAIFLTHNPWQHQRNLERGLQASEALLWKPELQEAKTSQYGSQALRYRIPLKREWIGQWQALHQDLIPWNEIRYIF